MWGRCIHLSCVQIPSTPLNAYFQKYQPMINWQMMFVVGIFLGAFFYSLFKKDFKNEWIPKMWKRRFGGSIFKRVFFAFLGGMIALFGARMAGGCPSGHGLSGMAQLSLSGFIALGCFLIGGCWTARKLYKRGE